MPAPAEYPASFRGFVGQAEAVELLRLEAEAARREGRPLAHLLLYGPPGVGKTAMAHVLAGEMGYALYESSGAEYQAQGDMLGALQSIAALHDATRRPILWLIDEVDGMARTAAYVVFGLMTHGYVTWRGGRYGGVPITVVGTTNRMASVPGALRSRFAEHVHLDFYPPEELAEVARRTAVGMGMLLTSSAADFIGQNAGGEPRKVNRRILRGARNLVRGFMPTVDLEVVKRALELSGLRPGGLTKAQAEYLRFLAEAERQTAGLASLAAYLGMDARDVQFDVEPYLIRSGLAAVARAGRTLTGAGRAYLQAQP